MEGKTKKERKRNAPSSVERHHLSVPSLRDQCIFLSRSLAANGRLRTVTLLLIVKKNV
jgi:hypothetical protein